MTDREETLKKLRDVRGSLFKIMAIMREEFPELEEIWQDAQAGSRVAMDDPMWAHFDEFAVAGTDVLSDAHLLGQLALSIFVLCVTMLSPNIKDPVSVLNELGAASQHLASWGGGADIDHDTSALGSWLSPDE